MPWNWNMSHTNCRYQGGFVDYWDLELGCAVHPDGTPRRGKKIMQDWADLLAGLSFSQEFHRQVVFIYPKRTVAGAGCREYFEFFRTENIPFIGVNDKDFSEYDLSHTIVVFAPYYGIGYRQSTYERLVSFAEEGGVVFAHNDNMQLDENGNFAKERNIPEFGKTVQIGKGKIRWYMGFNDSNMLGVCDPKLFEGLPIIRRLDTCIPLKGGRICIEEQLSVDEKTMNTDWIPNQKLPDRNMPVRIEIQNDRQEVERGWVKNGQNLKIEGMTFTSQKPLFVIRLSADEILVSGTEFDIYGGGDGIECALADYCGKECKSSLLGYGELQQEKTNKGIHVRLRGWQRMYWVSVKR